MNWDDNEIYYLSIGAVDGTTSYHMSSDNKQSLLEFLRLYDHEGSSISIHRERDNRITFNGEAVYKILRNEDE